MTETATAPPAGIQIECAKPDCHWKGSPQDAAAHPCPQPAETAGDPFAGILDVDGIPLADANVDRSQPYLVVWADGGELRLIASSATEEAAIALVSKIEQPSRGEITIQRTASSPPAIDADPQTRDELEAWLLTHGDYDEQGVPQDERTATLDARFSALEQASGELAGEDEEPDLDDDEPLEGEVVQPDDDAAPDEPEATVVQEEPELELDEPQTPLEEAITEHAEARIWQEAIAETLETQTGVAEMRWLCVWHPGDEHREAELLGRGRTRAEADEIAENARERGELDGKLEVVKTQAVLDAVAEIERRRELVETPPAEPELEPPAEPAEEDAKTEEEQKTAQEAAAEAQAAAAKLAPDPKGAGLFDASDFDREDLALPKIDGRGIDRIAVAFSGEVMLDRSNPDHVALFRRMKLGKSLECLVEVKGLGFAGKGATNKDGELDVVVGKRNVVVQTVRIIEPEQLAAVQAELAAQAQDAHDAGQDGLDAS